MTITGVGVDLEEIDQFRRTKYSDNKRFYEKLFTTAEIGYCLKKTDPYLHFAVRFCAKEAFIKASGLSVKDFKKIEVVMRDGRPCMKTSLIKEVVHLSLSHSEDTAIAVVVIERLHC